MLHLRRYTRGEVVDDYCNAPHLCDLYAGLPDEPPYREEKGEEELNALTRGDLGAWRDLMVEGTDVDRLREIWDSEPVLADDILWATADALAMKRDEMDADFLYGSQGFTRLTLRLKELPQYRVKAEGPPKLTLAAYTGLTEVYVGQEYAPQFYVQNDGGASAGLDVVAWGSAVDQGIVQLHKVVVARRSASGDAREASFLAQPARIAGEEVAACVGCFGAFELPPGIAGGREVLSGPGVSLQKAFDALEQSQVFVRVPFSVERPGSGELLIGFVPHANRQDGQTVWRASLRALPMPRQPLRCSESAYGLAGRWLRALEVPRHLFALVSMGAGREESAQAAAGVIEAWVAKVTEKKGDRLTAYLRTRLDLRPGRERFTAADIPGSDRWQELRDGLANCVSLTIERDTSRVSFDMNGLFFQASVEEQAPHLGLWFATEALDESELKAMSDWLAGLVDGLMQRAAGLQAVVGRWDWGQATNLDMTPYEVACGVAGQCTTARFWCKEFLRGVTGRLWLGPDLLARLGGTDGLAPIATVTPVGEAVRVTLKEGATLEQLEQALAPLLPGGKDWRQGVERLFPRRWPPARPTSLAN